MADLPRKLAEMLEDFDSLTDRRERQELLIETADRFRDGARVPESVAVRPYPEGHRVPACESEAFVWAVDRPDGTQTYYFDVLNPQGLSAMAMSVILHETCSGAPPAQVAAVPTDIVYRIFGKELSMGKGIGVMGIVALVVALAKRKAGERAGA